MAAKTTAAKKGPTQGCKSRACKKSANPAGLSHEFTLMAPQAAEVYLVGDFNNWENGKDKMRKFKSGLHKKSLRLKPGRYEYRLVVDGAWWTDPANDQRVANTYGEDNSVIVIG